MLITLMELQKRGVYASAVIKKRRYWPKYIKGKDNIKEHFEDKAIGNYDALPGTLLLGVPFHIFYMKEDTYTMMLMSTDMNMMMGRGRSLLYRSLV